MRLALSAVLALVVGGAAVVAQEHPEHPEGKTAATKAISIDDLEKSIKSSIAEKEKSGGGYYKLADKIATKTWLLKLDHVHRERLSRLDEKTYFACTDFKSSDGHTVDVDFFMKDKDGKLVMSDATVHKIDGKPRYDWEEENGFWKRVPVKE
ncbi:MAG TPA: hypothetical protein VIM68_04265 [Thermoanaerobaculia bacterium]|jgi:hypothetical protein